MACDSNEEKNKFKKESCSYNATPNQCVDSRPGAGEHRSRLGRERGHRRRRLFNRHSSIRVVVQGAGHAHARRGAGSNARPAHIATRVRPFRFRRAGAWRRRLRGKRMARRASRSHGPDPEVAPRRTPARAPFALRGPNQHLVRASRPDRPVTAAAWHDLPRTSRDDPVENSSDPRTPATPLTLSLEPAPARGQSLRTAYRTGRHRRSRRI